MSSANTKTANVLSSQLIGELRELRKQNEETAWQRAEDAVDKMFQIAAEMDESRRERIACAVATGLLARGGGYTSGFENRFKSACLRHIDALMEVLEEKGEKD